MQRTVQQLLGTTSSIHDAAGVERAQAGAPGIGHELGAVKLSRRRLPGAPSMASPVESSIDPSRTLPIWSSGDFPLAAALPDRAAHRDVAGLTRHLPLLPASSGSRPSRRLRSEFCLQRLARVAATPLTQIRIFAETLLLERNPHACGAPRALEIHSTARRGG